MHFRIFVMKVFFFHTLPTQWIYLRDILFFIMVYCFNVKYMVKLLLERGYGSMVE